MRMHNTANSVDVMNSLHPTLGKAWSIHCEQDLMSHAEDYSVSDDGLRLPHVVIPDDSVMLFSGGLDSFIQWRLLEQPKAIYFAIGHKAESKELGNIGRIRQKFNGDIGIKFFLNLGRFEFNNGYIPFRNLLFLILASNYSDNIILCQIAEWAPDKNKYFYRKTEQLLREAGKGSFQGINKKVKVYTPFAGYTKTQLVKEYLKIGPAEDLTTYTRSCYSDGELSCGKCTACISRYVAMVNNGISERYEQIPNLSDYKKKFSMRDFRFDQVGMYLKKWWEFRLFESKLKDVG